MDPVTAVGVVLALIDKVAQIGGMISKAQAEKRDLTAAEVDAIVAMDDSARQQLVSAIAAAKAAGR